MNKLIQRIRRVAWTYRQPLTRIPSQVGAPISDLFLWRKGQDWQTSFELTDMAGLYETGERIFRDKTCVRVFDTVGTQIGQQEFTPPLYRRQQIDISALVEATHHCVGTFSVFHSHTPNVVQQLGCHLAERGYVSYRYRGAPLRAYVHGNLDAVALEEQQIALLAGSGLLMREYRLQHEMLPGSRYEIAVVNPSPSSQKVIFEVLDAVRGNKLSVQSTTLTPGACHLFELAPEQVSQRIVIRSRLVMARPLIFRIENQRMDVLHG